MICLKNRTFAVSQTTLQLFLLPHLGCDLLEKSYFCSITNNPATLKWYNGYVVICLKNRTFAVSQTTVEVDGFRFIPLWFAWKIVLLQYHKQHLIYLDHFQGCCDLLEKSYFCSITNNSIPVIDYNGGVVICLKNRTFAVSQTTKRFEMGCRFWLWFAWKIVLLQYHKQLGG